jgi:heme exporter protein A
VQLIADNLTLMRGARTVIDRLSFRAAAGETLLLTGPNGAGKTTLMRALAGLLRPSAGTIRLDGGAAETEAAEQAHYVGHLNGIKPSLTVAENLAFWGAYLDGGGGPDDVSEALERFNLASLAGIPAGYLSAGQKRRLGLARLLVARRPVWLLDEPTVSLDAASTRLLAEVVDAHVAAGGLVVAATHLPLGLARTQELRLGASSTREDGKP